MDKNENKIVYDAGYDEVKDPHSGKKLIAFLIVFALLIAASVLFSGNANGAQEPLFRTVYTYSPSKGVTHSIIRDTEIGTEYIVIETKNGVAVCTRVTPLDGKPFTASKYTGEGVATK